MVWSIENSVKINLNKPIFIAGLPGIGNVSKITVDFIITELKAKKIGDLFSHYLPHSVFVNEKNLIKIPGIALYHKKINGIDFIFLAGDAQPIDEPSTYRLCETILDFLEKNNCKEIVCLAGIGLQHEPVKPKIYCTANNKEIINRYKKEIKLNNKISGIVGPIIGTAGLLPGLASRRKIDAIILLAETFAHPLYIGIKSAKEIVKLLNQKFKLNLSIKKLDKDIKELEKSVKNRTKNIIKMNKELKDIKSKETKYIG